MINLLPPQGKKMVAREYIMRVCTVAGFASAFVLVASAVALMPTYLLFAVPSPVEGAQADARVSQGEEHYAQIADTLKTSMVSAGQLGRRIPTLETSNIVTHIEAALSSEIILGSMQFSRDKDKVHIEAHGIAQTRESLRKFLDTLKQDTFFADAQVPVSDLVRDTDAQFTLTLTLRSS